MKENTTPDVDSRRKNLRRKGVADLYCKMPLIAPIAVECVFWAEDDGWKGVCESLDLSVRVRNFEESKKSMETVLKTYVRSLFREAA
jgi:hypothetical protein